MAAIVSIIAKLMVLVDEVLGVFATAVWLPAMGDCSINAINAELTDCGTALVHEIGTLIYFASQLGGQFLAALGAY